MSEGRNLITVWFFIGVLLLIYGIAILGQGIYELQHPETRTVVLAELNATVWWGAVLLVIGIVYTYAFAPWRKK